MSTRPAFTSWTINLDGESFGTDIVARLQKLFLRSQLRNIGHFESGRISVNQIYHAFYEDKHCGQENKLEEVRQTEGQIVEKIP